MPVRFFISQDSLDLEVASDNASLEEDVLRIHSRRLRADVTPALYFLREVEGKEDPNGWVGKVRSVESMVQKGADIFRGSVILGDNAYDVVEGYLGVADPGWAWPDGTPSEPTPPHDLEPPPEERSPTPGAALARPRRPTVSPGFRAPKAPLAGAVEDNGPLARRATLSPQGDETKKSAERRSVPPPRPPSEPPEKTTQAVDDLEKLLLDTVKPTRRAKKR